MTIEVKNLVNRKFGNHLPRFQWYEFSHSFSPMLLDFLLEQSIFANRSRKSLVLLDPYCGSGTLSLRAAQLDIECHSMDLLPSSYHITKAKTSIYNQDIIKMYKSTLLLHQPKEINTDVEIMFKLFDYSCMNYLLSLGSVIKTFESPYDSLFFTILFRISEKFSSGKKSGATYRMQAKKEEWSAEDIKASLEVEIDTFIAEAISSNDVKEGKVYLGDARFPYELAENSIDWIITSPPYPNRQDYTRIFAPELALCYSSQRSDHKNLRKRTMRSHLEAGPVTQTLDGYDYFDSDIQDWVTQVSSAYSDQRVSRMLHGYFEDMYISLKNWQKILKDQGMITIITSNSKYADIHIEVDSIIKKMAENLGYEIIMDEVLRYRGNTPQQMKEYKRQPMRETIITIRKV